MRTNGWQAETITALTGLLEDDPTVRALVLFGSAASGMCDAWSDIDLLLVVDEQALWHFFPTLDWLQALGEVYAFEQFPQVHGGLTRVCFSDLRRLDFVIVCESFVAQQDWSAKLSGGAHPLFSRSAAVERLLATTQVQPPPRLIAPEEFERMVQQFWYKAVMATTKVVRNDQLIALHLALELLQECCVLQMLLRDRVSGTNQHRDGGIGNVFVAQLEGMPPVYNAASILDLVEQSSRLFDALAGQWSDIYVERHTSLSTLLEQARRTLADHTDL